MPDYETPTERYRRLAEECLHVANDFPPGENRDAPLQMAQVWRRLADQYPDSSGLQPSTGEQPIMQQQQIQPDDDKNE
jgi:hypothetical protein